MKIILITYIIASLLLGIFCLTGLHSLVSDYIFSMDMQVSSYDGIDKETIVEVFVVSLLAIFFISSSAIGLNNLLSKEE